MTLIETMAYVIGRAVDAPTNKDSFPETWFNLKSAARAALDVLAANISEEMIEAGSLVGNIPERAASETFAAMLKAARDEDDAQRMVRSPTRA